MDWILQKQDSFPQKYPVRKNSLTALESDCR